MLYLTTGDELFITKVLIQRNCKIYSVIRDVVHLKDILNTYSNKDNLGLTYSLGQLPFKQREECLQMLVENSLESKNNKDIYLVEKDIYFLLYIQYIIAEHTTNNRVHIEYDKTFEPYFCNVKGLFIEPTDVNIIDFNSIGKPSKEYQGFFTEEVHLQNKITRLIS